MFETLFKYPRVVARHVQARLPKPGADDVLAGAVALVLCGVQVRRLLDSIGVPRCAPHNCGGHITHLMWRAT